MVLRGLLYQLTGDEAVTATQVKTARVGLAEIPVVATEEDVHLLRKKACVFLSEYRDAKAAIIDLGPRERWKASMQLTLGDDLADTDVELWFGELGLDPWARSLKWKADESHDRLKSFSVFVVGAGMGGLNAALQLKHAGIPYIQVEKD